MPSDFAVHSDLLVHWTGKDFDPWCKDDSSKNELYSKCDDELVKRYVERLRNILKYGLWMTEQSCEVPGAQVTPAPCTCFTELKLSQSRTHARKYGRLGIAFKRPFLFKRGGRPVTYFGSSSNGWHKLDWLLKVCRDELETNDALHFFKPMNSQTRLSYDFYSESEWRIVYSDDRIKSDMVIDPRDTKNQGVCQYFSELPSDAQTVLRYLLPVDGWLAAIIYPSIDAKNRAQDPSSGIPELIRKLKADKHDHANTVEGGNYPVEMDLDLCRNF
jgi:hypothetical protein